MAVEVVVLKEGARGEKRVAATPETVKMPFAAVPDVPIRLTRSLAETRMVPASPSPIVLEKIVLPPFNSTTLPVKLISPP